jgi:hypothetical protein
MLTLYIPARPAPEDLSEEVSGIAPYLLFKRKGWL